MRDGWHIEVPSNLGDKMLLEFFRGWDWKDDPVSPVTIDFRQVEHIAPWAVALFSAYAIWLREVRDKEVIILFNEISAAGRYLIQAGVPKLLNVPVTSDYSLIEDRISPLVRIQDSSQISEISNSMMQVLNLDDEEMGGAIRYSLVELLRNVVQHSRSRTGGVCLATYYPNAELAVLVIADTGCGIRASLRNRYPGLNQDMKAVKYAVQPHVSSTFLHGAYNTMENNAGLGLFFIKEIVSRGGGGLFLGSGEAIVDFWGNEDGTASKYYRGSRTGGWRGTFAVVQLRRNMIVEFGSLLQRCRDIAAAVRKDPTELNLDFIEDVPDIDGLKVISVKEFEENVERAAIIRDQEVIPVLEGGGMVVLDFDQIQFATQSFAHACMYKIFRDIPNAQAGLTISRASTATQQAIRAVAAYASTDVNDSL